MKASQFIYTSCLNKGSAISGYMVYGRSDDIAQSDGDIIQEKLNYKPRANYSLKESDEKVILSTFPRGFALFKLSNGRYCVGQTTYIGLDCTKNRYGNYMLHAYVLGDLSQINPYSLFKSKQFRTRLTEEEMNEAVPETLPSVDLHNEVLTKVDISKFNRKTLLQFLLFIRRKAYDSSDKIFVRVKKDDIQTVLALMSYSLKDNDYPTLQVYSNMVFETKEGINIYFEEESVVESINRLFGDFTVYYFDLYNGQANFEAEPNKVEQIFFDFLFEDEDAAVDFYSEIISIQEKYQIPSEEDALDVKYLFEKEIDVIGIKRAMDLYSRYLTSFGLSEVANALYNRISDPTSPYQQSLYHDLSNAHKKEVIDTYFNNAFNNNNDVNAIMDELLRCPYVNNQEVVKALLQKACQDFFVQKGDKGIKFVMLINNIHEKNDQKMVDLYRQLSKESQESIYDFIQENLLDNEYPLFMKEVYHVVKDNLSNIQDYSLFYKYLSKEEQLSILDIFTDSVISKKPSVEECLLQLKESNPFFHSEDEALDYLISPRTFKYLFSNFGDYGKLLVLRLYCFVKGDIADKDLLSVYLSLEKRDKSIQQPFFEIISHLEERGKGEALVNKFIEENLSTYETESEVDSLLKDLANYPKLIKKVLLTSFENDVISLNYLLDYCKDAPHLEGERFALIAEINKYRTNPKEAKRICNEHKDDKIAQVYLSSNFSDDVNKLIRGAHFPQEAMDIIKDYDISRHDFERLLGVILSAPLDQLVHLLENKEIAILNERIKKEGMDISKVGEELLAFYYIDEASKGNFEPAKKAGYPNREIIPHHPSKEFIMNVASKAMLICLASKSPEKDFKAFLAPIANFTGVKKAIKHERDNKEFLKSAHLYVLSEKDNTHLKKFLVKVMMKHLSRFKEDEREKEMRLLGITLKDENIYKKKPGLFYRLFGPKEENNEKK